MKKPKIFFDRNGFLKEFECAEDMIFEAEKLGKEFADKKFERLFMTGCGAPHYMMRVLAFWANRVVIKTDIRTFHSADLIHQNPSALDDKTLVLLGSHSGTTKETVEAAEFLKIRPAQAVSITRDPESPLAKASDAVLAYADEKQGYFSSYMLAQALASAFLDGREEGWKYHSKIMRALPELPYALADAKGAGMPKSEKIAEKIKEEKVPYVIAAGPMFTTAYVFASCFLMEMQHMHAHAVNAADFFHGPFEVVENQTPLIVLLGEDPCRSQADRVLEFCKRFSVNYYIYDSREFNMPGIPEEIRPLVSPFIVDAAMTSLVENLAMRRGHPMSFRRYMGKVEY